MALPIVRIEVNSEAVRAILKSPEVARLLTDMGESMIDAAGSGHRIDVDYGPRRVRVEVVTDTFAAMRREAEDRSLTAAVDHGRR